MLPALTIGATGCVDGPPNMAPELWVEIWNAYQAGDLERAEAAQDRACEAADRMFACGGGFHALLKATLSERLGIDCGHPRAPGSPLTVEQHTTLRKTIAELGLTSVTIS